MLNKPVSINHKNSGIWNIFKSLIENQSVRLTDKLLRLIYIGIRACQSLKNEEPEKNEETVQETVLRLNYSNFSVFVWRLWTNSKRSRMKRTRISQAKSFKLALTDFPNKTIEHAAWVIICTEPKKLNSSRTT